MRVQDETDSRYIVRRDFRTSVDGVPMTEVRVNPQRHLNPSKDSHDPQEIQSAADFVAFNGENARAVFCGLCFQERPYTGGSFLGFILDDGRTASGLHRRERNRGIQGQDQNYWAHDGSQTVVCCPKGHNVSCDTHSIRQALTKALPQGSEVLWLT